MGIASGPLLRKVLSTSVAAIGALAAVLTVFVARLECVPLGDFFWEISPAAEQSLAWSDWEKDPNGNSRVPWPFPGLTESRKAQVTTLFNTYTIHQARNPARPDVRVMVPEMNRKKPRWDMLAAFLGGEIGIPVVLAWGLLRKRKPPK